MYFKEFRGICQDYCYEFRYPFQSRKVYKELWRIYEAWLNKPSDDDIQVGRFLDEHSHYLKKEEMITTYADECKACDTPKRALNWAKPVPTVSLGYTTSNASLYAVVNPQIEYKLNCAKQEEENSMTANTERTYLNNRLNDVRYDHMDRNAVDFRIHNSDQPRTYKELIDAIKNDKYTLDTKATAKVDEAMEDQNRAYSPWGPMFGIKFDIPTAPDHDGWKKADTALTKAYTAAKDIINTADAAAGLKALQDFEAWTPEGKAN